MEEDTQDQETFNITPFGVVLFTTLANWSVFLVVLVCLWLYMDTQNLQKELEYTHYFQSAITEENLQTIMCNGDPA